MVVESIDVPRNETKHAVPPLSSPQPDRQDTSTQLCPFMVWANFVGENQRMGSKYRNGIPPHACTHVAATVRWSQSAELLHAYAVWTCMWPSRRAVMVGKHPSLTVRNQVHMLKREQSSE